MRGGGRWGLQWGASLATVLAPGCQDDRGATTDEALAAAHVSQGVAHDLARQVVAELEEFQGMAAGGTVPLLAVLLVLAALGSLWLSRWLRRWRREKGFLDGRLALVAFGTHLGVSVLLMVVAVRLLLGRVPLLTSLGLGLGVGGVIFTLARHIPAWLGGLSLILQRSVNEGDRLTLGSVEGTVDAVGLMRVVVRGAEGARTFLPLAALGQSEVTVVTPRQDHWAELVLCCPRTLSEKEQARLQALIELCPYRAGDTPVAVAWNHGEQHRALLRVACWSDEAARAAETFLTRAVQRELSFDVWPEHSAATTTASRDSSPAK